MKSNTKKIGAVVIIGILIVVSLVAVFYYLPEPKKKEPVSEKPEKVVDDRISPNANQALFVQILRIRNRGLMDKMLSYGTSWKDAPSFYYIVTVDDESGNSKGFVGQTGIYNTYDTIGYESTMTYDVEEGLKHSDVSISIIEEQHSGLLGRRINDVEVDKISLKYDYRTGRWDGDDSFMDKDGMGHYLGDNYEVWFNLYQADNDHDGIPYWTEVNILGTNPYNDDSKLDPDNDGIPTSWEWKWGYDPFTWNDHQNLDPDQDGIQNVEEYFMREHFSNPFQPDMYLEADGMQPKGPLDVIPHKFYEESQQMIIERYAQHGIWLYIDDGGNEWADGPVNGGGEMVPYVKDFDDVVAKQMLSFYTHNFADERKGIFRYLVVTDISGAFICPTKYNNINALCVGNGFSSAKVRLSFTRREMRVMLAKTVLHELGHSLGLMPTTFPGNDIMNRKYGDRYPSMSDEDYNGYLNDYYSVMNYQYIYNKPFFFNNGSHEYLFDYSDGSNGPPYDQNDWEHVYLPTFQIDAISYEEPSDETFEDFEIYNYYKGVVADGWQLDENLTEKYSTTFKDFSLQKNVDADVQVFIKTDANSSDGYNIRVYAKPNVEPVFAVYSLVAEGKLDSNNNVEFYSQQDAIRYVESLIK